MCRRKKEGKDAPAYLRCGASSACSIHTCTTQRVTMEILEAWEGTGREKMACGIEKQQDLKDLYSKQKDKNICHLHVRS